MTIKIPLLTALITKPVGKGFETDARDVSAVRKALNFIDASSDAEDRPFMDEVLERDIKIFQKKNDLRVDGILKPGGETEKALSDALIIKAKDDGIQREELPLLHIPIPIIPGTNIPDRGTSENRTHQRPDATRRDPDMDGGVWRRFPNPSNVPTGGRDKGIEIPLPAPSGSGNSGHGGGGFNT